MGVVLHEKPYLPSRFRHVFVDKPCLWDAAGVPLHSGLLVCSLV